jgi:hypothetical protein
MAALRARELDVAHGAVLSVQGLSAPPLQISQRLRIRPDGVKARSITPHNVYQVALNLDDLAKAPFGLCNVSYYATEGQCSCVHFVVLLLVYCGEALFILA